MIPVVFKPHQVYDTSEFKTHLSDHKVLCDHRIYFILTLMNRFRVEPDKDRPTNPWRQFPNNKE